MSPDESVQNYVNRLSVMGTQLSSIEWSIKTTERQSALRKGLRSEFGTTAEIIRLMYTSISEPMSMLTVREGTRRKPEKVSDSSCSQVLQVTRKNKCAYCKKKDH